ncbi:DUF1499 domain-containing protein [Neptuniibacter halophilus]|uniref:DUF1499 domain-containing protein n=1 Tax=Neptuniibacter halophilus TaxID=651666 RepID=UPI002572E884|nr:DUF1499 domain-containing protein [Neptuniibacter halophilus]
MQWIGLLLPVAIFLLFWLLAISSREGRAIGLTEGRLAGCPNKANCVCSEPDTRPESFIAPLQLPESVDSAEQVMPPLVALIEQAGGRVEIRSDLYLAAVFKSRFFGFVDDLEVRLDLAERQLHFRSASRVGHSDFGVNRKRVEQLQQKLAVASGSGSG